MQPYDPNVALATCKIHAFPNYWLCVKFVAEKFEVQCFDDKMRSSNQRINVYIVQNTLEFFCTQTLKVCGSTFNSNRVPQSNPGLPHAPVVATGSPCINTDPTRDEERHDIPSK